MQENMDTEREYPSCGLIQNPENGPKVVLAGYGSSEIFNLASETWRDGPETPYFYAAASTQLQDTFLVIGGTNGDGLDTIYEFDHINYDWILRPERLSQQKYGVGAIALPNDFVQC